jgi:hypothetical protein
MHKTVQQENVLASGDSPAVGEGTIPGKKRRKFAFFKKTGYFS